MTAAAGEAATQPARGGVGARAAPAGMDQRMRLACMGYQRRAWTGSSSPDEPLDSVDRAAPITGAARGEN